MATRIIHYDDLPQGGFAGIAEKRMVLNPVLWPQADNTIISEGLADFIYLAVGEFSPNDGAPIHPHNDVDIVSIVLSGGIGHKGSLGDGTEIRAPGVQVQRAGTGMRHSEFNLSDAPAEFAQLWFRPPAVDLAPAYQDINLEGAKLTTVLGGANGSFDSSMVCQVGALDSGQELIFEHPVACLITSGSGIANGEAVTKRDFIETDQLHFVAGEATGVVTIYQGKNGDKT